MLLPREASALLGEEGAKGFFSVLWVPGVQAPGRYSSSPTKHSLAAWPFSALAKREADSSPQRPGWTYLCGAAAGPVSPGLSAADSPLYLPHWRADDVGFLRGPTWAGESGVTLPRLAV